MADVTINMTEYGIFNDEGLLEGQFYDIAKAEAKLASDYNEDDAYVAAVCPYHSGEEAGHCQSCAQEECDEEADEEEDQL